MCLRRAERLLRGQSGTDVTGRGQLAARNAEVENVGRAVARTGLLALGVWYCLALKKVAIYCGLSVRRDPAVT